MALGAQAATSLTPGLEGCPRWAHSSVLPLQQGQLPMSHFLSPPRSPHLSREVRETCGPWR